MEKQETPRKGEQTPFERFEQMTKKIVSTPKAEADKRERLQKARRSQRRP